MYNRFRRSNWHYNDNQVLEDICANVSNYANSDMNDSCCNDCCDNCCNNSCNNCCDNCSMNNYNCQCGFDEGINVFPDNPMLAQSYVPIQTLDKTFTPCCGLKNGTIFPELVSPYEPCQSMEFINYLKARNNIGEGCNG